LEEPALPEPGEDFEWVDPLELDETEFEPVEEEPVTETENLDQELDEETKNLPVWFWPVVGTSASLLILTTIIACYMCSRKETPQEAEKSEISAFKDKTCWTKFADCFRPPPSRPGSMVEQTPAKDQMVDEESGTINASARQNVEKDDSQQQVIE